MRTALILCILLCAASAAPAGETELEVAGGEVELPQVHLPAAEPEEEMKKMMTEEETELAPVDPFPVAEDEAVFEEASNPEARFGICPDGWLRHNSHCFLFNHFHRSWFDAEEYCNSQGAQLTSATNPQQYRFLQQMSSAMRLSTAWLGGFHLQGRWLWIDSEGFYYENWHSQSSPSSCPCLYLNSNVGWANGVCSSTRPFICSRKLFAC
ncbi:ladderlectin-like isoform X2 [Notolabrus celidotus]|uniref:ladderlectin-like isoform X2 n=1 Tax=Notolabrus celidotus TaxID=1203425 RepID=UPI0014906C19|nr:ladderlectin-like isoform X2 [Notolabrus celidotus]